MYYRRYFVDKGGLISYGPDIRQQFSGVAEYVDRVLQGAKPADLPVQAPTKYELVINLKTAKLLGLELPQGLLSAADEVIESPHVRFWPLADMSCCAAHVRF